MNIQKIIVVIALCGMMIGCPRGKESGAGGFAWVIKTATELPDVNPLAVVGNISIAGSSTVFPLAEAMAARFNDEGYSYSVTIDSVGSGAGFERFCVAGESDIANASRPIKDSEREACQQIGREPIEMRIGTDTLAIAVNPNNTWIDSTTVAELAEIFTADRWSDVNAQWPNQPIERFVPGTDSGTFDYFIEEVFEHDSKPILTANNTQFSEDDNVLVRGISGSTYAIGFFGYAYATNNADILKVLNIAGVTPSVDNVNNNLYPLSRPLFMYSDATIIAERPQVGAFLAYVLNYVDEEVIAVGYFTADLEPAQAALVAVLRGAGAIE